MEKMCREQRYLRVGKEAMVHSTCHTQMSALVVKKGMVISQGVNKKGFRGSSIHAEIDALKQLERQKNGAEGADLWLFRFGGFNGTTHRMSKPCSVCMEAIHAAGIKRVFYYDWEGELQTFKVGKDIEEYYTITRVIKD